MSENESTIPTETVTDKTKQLILNAIENSSQEYLEKTFAMRNPGVAAFGSTFLETKTLEDIKAADWVEVTEKVKLNGAAAEGCLYFQAPIPGRLGIISLAKLPSGVLVSLTDPKGTMGTPHGSLVPEVLLPEASKEEVGFTTLILGPKTDEHDSPLVVYTFHPGEPAPLPAKVVNMPKLKDRVVTVHRALELGFSYAKVLHGETPTVASVRPPAKVKKKHQTRSKKRRAIRNGHKRP